MHTGLRTLCPFDLGSMNSAERSLRRLGLGLCGSQTTFNDQRHPPGVHFLEGQALSSRTAMLSSGHI